MSGQEPGRLERDTRGRVMRHGRVLDAPVQIDGYDPAGRRRVSAHLPHGVHPADLLRSHGWEPERPLSAERAIGDPHGIVLSWAVTARPGGPCPLPDEPVQIDEGIVVDPEEPPLVRTRVAAYALVASGAGLLLTSGSAKTNAEGAWGLPGGGIEPGEDPTAAVVREVWEETGQDICRPRLVDVLSHHWVGLSPKGVLEDFQAVRLVYRADLLRCADLVVHDDDGTTADARWFPLDELGSIDLAPAWRDFAARYRPASTDRPRDV